jgi:hypothetical protein
MALAADETSQSARKTSAPVTCLNVTRKGTASRIGKLGAQVKIKFKRSAFSGLVCSVSRFTSFEIEPKTASSSPTQGAFARSAFGRRTFWVWPMTKVSRSYPELRRGKAGRFTYKGGYSHSIPPTLQHSNTPTLQHSNTPTLHYSITPSLHHSITPTLQHSNTPSPHHSAKRQTPNVERRTFKSRCERESSTGTVGRVLFRATGKNLFSAGLPQSRRGP